MHCMDCISNHSSTLCDFDSCFANLQAFNKKCWSLKRFNPPFEGGSSKIVVFEAWSATGTLSRQWWPTPYQEISKRCSKTLVFSVSCFYSEWTDCDTWWWKKQYLQGQLQNVPTACIWGQRLQERCCQLKGSLMSLLQGHNVDTTCGLPMTVPWPHAVLTSCLLIHGFAADSSGIGNGASWSRGSTQASTDPSQSNKLHLEQPECATNHGQYRKIKCVSVFLTHVFFTLCFQKVISGRKRCLGNEKKSLGLSKTYEIHTHPLLVWGCRQKINQIIACMHMLLNITYTDLVCFGNFRTLLDHLKPSSDKIWAVVETKHRPSMPRICWIASRWQVWQTFRLIVIQVDQMSPAGQL